MGTGKRRKKRRKNNPLPIVICLIIVAAVVAAGVFFMAGGDLNGRVADKNAYFNNYDDDRAAVVINDEVAEEQALVRDGEYYLPYSAVWDINPAFYYDKDKKELRLTLQDETVIRTPDDGTGELYVGDDKEAYISQTLINEYSGLECSVYEDPKRLVIYTEAYSAEILKVKQDTKLYLEADNKKDVLKELTAGDILMEKADLDSCCKVATADGYMGYVSYDDFYVTGEVKTCSAQNRTDFTRLTFGETIRLVWHWADNYVNNADMETLLAGSSGVNVIAPTWFQLSSEGELVGSSADETYADRAHALGLKVWPVLKDDSTGSLTAGELLADQDSREQIINQLMSLCEAYKADGINIDLETIKEKDAPAYIEFLRELSVKTHQAGLILSVDNYVPLYTSYYRRDAQSEAVDYLIIMGYDEYTGVSEEPGPVASMPFVRKAVEMTLDEVPADQVVLGVPFFSRTWEERFGSGDLISDAVSNAYGLMFAQEHGIDLYWDAAAGCITGSAEDGQSRWSIWLENDASLKEKLSLISEYSLAGAAAWRLGNEDSNVWPVWASVE